MTFETDRPRSPADISSTPVEDLVAERDQWRADAEALLIRADGDDLVGVDATRFDDLTARIEARDTEIAQAIEHRDRIESMLRRLRTGELRTEGGSTGGHYPSTAGVSARSKLSPLFPSAENLQRLEQARTNLTSLSVIEERAAIKTTDMGTGTEYASSGMAAPRSLWRASGIPTTAPNGYHGVVPQYTLPAGASLATEGNAHAEFDAVAPDSVTIGRAGSWSDLTSEGLLSSTLDEISSKHAHIIARNIDKATVAKIEDTPGVLDIDEALQTVAAECAVDSSGLWIFGDPAAISELVGVATAMTPTNAADVGSYAVRYGGASLYATREATIATLTVFHPGSFRAFATGLASSLVVDPTTGAQRFGQWLFFGLGCTLVGSAITVPYGAS